MRFRTLCSTLVLAACWGLTGTVFSQQGKPATSTVKLAPSRPAAEEPAFTMTPEREAAAMTFARRHHRELAVLLDQLKQMNPERYENAVTDLYRASERLTRLQERQPERYESELAIWKIDSRVRLLAARSLAGMDDSVKAQIKKLLIERNNIRVGQLEADRDRLQARVERMNETIQEFRNDSQQLAERDLDRLLKNVRGRTPDSPPPQKRNSPPETSKSRK